MTKDLFQDVAEFHQRFGLPQRRPGELLPQDLLRMRLKRLLEEVKELTDALARRDLVAVADACVDINYINLGNAWLLNVPFTAAHDEVHATNMKKERAGNASESKYGSLYDIVKPKGWRAPDLAQFVPVEDLNLRVEDPVKQEQHDLLDYLAGVK